jgi:hypothetical protein
MEDKCLLNGEQIITQSDGNIITLTNIRIRYSDKQFGKAHIISIMLEKVGSIEVKYQSNIVLLILAIIGFLAALFGLASNESELVFFGLIAGGILTASYLGTRKHALAITSDSGKGILFHTKGMKQEAVLKFIDQVEQAISEIKN